MYDVPSQPDQSRHMSTRRWVGWIVVCALAAFGALALALAVTALVNLAPLTELLLGFGLFVLVLNGLLWVLILRGLQVPASWVAWSLPGGLLAAVLAHIARPDQVPAPWGLVLVLATLFVSLLLSQWLVLRRRLPQAGALVLVEAGVFLVIYGALGWMLLDAIAQLS